MVGWTHFDNRMVTQSAALVALLAGAAQAADHNGELQPTSSVTVNISLSVAAQYTIKQVTDLKTGKIRPDAGPGDLCIASNSMPMTLPVQLVLIESTSPGWAARYGVNGESEELVGAIGKCGPATQSPVRSIGSARQPGVRLLLIRPE